MLHNLIIEKYRLFNYFEVTSLAKVNLIVGTNNSGKSSLLEAIHLLTSDDVRSSLIDLLHERSEFVSGKIDPRFERVTYSYQLSHIFHKRLLDSEQVIRISASNGQTILLKITLDDNGYTNEEGIYLVFNHFKPKHDNSIESIIRLDADGLLSTQQPHKRYLRKASSLSGDSKLITTNQLRYNELATLWDKITLTPNENKVIEALQIIEPNVSRISFTSNQTSNNGILVRLDNHTKPIPLGTMGDGMHRILAIVASLITVGEGTLLVDEIDTGLYYAVLKDMWRLILETAHKQNVQVFATTHSWDCVKAFQQALSEFQDAEFGQLIRLDRVDNQIKAVSYPADELSIAIEQNIEVR